MNDAPERAPESARREIGGARTSDVRACGDDPSRGDNRPTEPSPPPSHVEEEQPPPVTSRMGSAPPRQPAPLRIGKPSGESPPDSHLSLMPPPPRSSSRPVFRNPNVLDGMWFLSLRSLARNIDPEPSSERSAAAVAARGAALQVIRILVACLQSFGDAVMRGEPWTIMAREVGRDGGKVTIEIAIEPLDGAEAEEGASHAG